MTRKPWHRRYHSDAIGGYMSLTLEERGAYTTILDLLYDCGEPIVDNERYLAGVMGCSIRKYRAMRDSLLDKGKIHFTEDGRISNPRFEKEVENDAKFSRKQAENGSKPKRNAAETAEKSNETNGVAEPDPIPRAFSTSTSISREEKTEANASAKKGTRLPDDWTLPKEWRDWAFEQGLDPPDITDQAERFADYWQGLAGQRATKLDWKKTWRNWIRNSGAKRKGNGNGQRSRADEWFEAAGLGSGGSEVDHGEGFGGTVIDLPREAYGRR